MLTDLTSVTLLSPTFLCLDRWPFCIPSGKACHQAWGYWQCGGNLGPGAQGTCRMDNWPPLPLRGDWLKGQSWRIGSTVSQPGSRVPPEERWELGGEATTKARWLFTWVLSGSGLKGWHVWQEVAWQDGMSYTKWPERMACLNKAKRVLPDIRSADGEILIFCLTV